MDSKEIFSSLNLISNTYFFFYLFFFYSFIFFSFILHLLFIFIFHFCGSVIRIFWNTQSLFPFIYFLHSSSFSSLFSFYFPFSFPLLLSLHVSLYFSLFPSISLSNFSIYYHRKLTFLFDTRGTVPLYSTLLFLSHLPSFLFHLFPFLYLFLSFIFLTFLYRLMHC